MASIFKEAFARKKEEEHELEAFRKEIEEFAAGEAEREKTGHFEGIDFKANDLTEGDLSIWKKIGDETVTTENFMAYRDKFNKDNGSKSPTRAGFMSLAGNKATEVIAKLETFRDEIGKFAEEEALSKKTAHFKNVLFNPDDLTGDDRRIWEKITDKTVTQKDFSAYCKKFGEGEGGKSSTRNGFMSLASNRAATIIGRRELEEMKKEKRP